MRTCPCYNYTFSEGLQPYVKVISHGAIDIV